MADGTRDVNARDAVDRILAAWARERPELDTAPAAVIGRLRWHFDAGLERTFRRYGLTRATFDVLAGTTTIGPPLPLATEGIDGRVNAYVGDDEFSYRSARERRTRDPDPDDGRRVLVTLTKKGLRLIDVVAPAHLANEAQMLAALSPSERATLVKLLRKLLLAFEGPSADVANAVLADG
jgi:hypothetical protein